VKQTYFILSGCYSGRRGRPPWTHAPIQPSAPVALWVVFKMAAIMESAEELCEKDAKTEQECFGELLPCRKISPLEPFIKLEEYFMLERDTGKCE